MKARDLLEMADGADLQQLAHTIFQMAEKEAYDAAAQDGRSVSHDEILAVTKSILQTLEDGISDLIRQDFQS